MSTVRSHSIHPPLGTVRSALQRDNSPDTALSRKRENKTMAWPFCPQCRATLTVDSSGRVSCGCCQYESNLSFMRGNLPSNTTVSPDTPMANWARSEEEQARVAATSNSASRNRATVEEPCIQCGHPEVGFYTVQLRSVDEGQTVFYECPACKHTWSVNN